MCFDPCLEGRRASHRLDLSDALFDDRARRAGVRLVQGDAAKMPFGEAEFDLVSSFNAFEHVTDTEAVCRRRFA